MKKEQKSFSELYSPEMILRIDEVHSMIMEQAGDLNLSSLIPNWKNMEMKDLGNSIVSVSSKLSRVNKSSVKEDLSDWSKSIWSPEWRSSKFGKMSPSEVAEYVHSSPSRRKEVRDFLEKEYQWLISQAPKSWIARSIVAGQQKQIKKGQDPFDIFYGQGETNKSGILLFISALILFIQLLTWLMF